MPESRLVGPSSAAHPRMWCASVQLGGRSQSGQRQPPSRAPSSARWPSEKSRCSLPRSMPAPCSSKTRVHAARVVLDSLIPGGLVLVHEPDSAALGAGQGIEGAHEVCAVFGRVEAVQPHPAVGEAPGAQVPVVVGGFLPGLDADLIQFIAHPAGPLEQLVGVQGIRFSQEQDKGVGQFLRGDRLIEIAEALPERIDLLHRDPAVLQGPGEGSMPRRRRLIEGRLHGVLGGIRLGEQTPDREQLDGVPRAGTGQLPDHRLRRQEPPPRRQARAAELRAGPAGQGRRDPRGPGLEPPSGTRDEILDGQHRFVAEPVVVGRRPACVRDGIRYRPQPAHKLVE
jgi:hypothetical protein